MSGTLKKIKLLIGKMSAFGWYIPVSTLFLLYARRFIPHAIRAKIAGKKHRMVKKYLTESLKETFSDIDRKTFSPVYEAMSPIWFCWLQGEDALPEIPRLCLANLRKHSNGHPVNVVTYSNYTDYVELPNHIVELYVNKKMKIAHFADILRVTLMYKHGGLWMDSTIYLTSDISEDIFTRPFYSIKTQEAGLYVSHCRWTSFFLAGWKGNPLYASLCELLCEYWNKNVYDVDYLFFDYLIDILYNRSDIIKEMIDDVPMNNPDIYFISDSLLKRYDCRVFEEIKRDTNVFKLKWRVKGDANTTGLTYYKYIHQSV